MVQTTLHDQCFAAYILLMILWAVSHPLEPLEDLAQELNLDIGCILAIHQTQYLQGQPPVLKSGSLHLAWEYAQSPSDHHHFINMLCVSPEVFQVILSLIKDHQVFFNNSGNAQEVIEVQLGVTLYEMGQYGNGASLEDIAHFVGCSEGAEQEKCWVDGHLGFKGTWWEGWVMYDGTIVSLYAKLAVNGEAYFNCKSNYGLNVQV
ncbi:hypothetical protein PAXRUDRAFT_148483 [Paxillus rubicundulus Ve08.2h10]|uniref:Uncharacterized protein n=1 Tax=Paxillus rubicundulus Ve08.2h10 TaxID=930991 RepID=A0A0D0D5G5_9AGAM|nr:hypothetical protein PAXRUDRAFT_148483 [Paxillus rubicundulus Ve08.2h10]